MTDLSAPLRFTFADLSILALMFLIKLELASDEVHPVSGTPSQIGDELTPAGSAAT